MHIERRKQIPESSLGDSRNNALNDQLATFLRVAVDPALEEVRLQVLVRAESTLLIVIGVRFAWSRCERVQRGNCNSQSVSLNLKRNDVGVLVHGLGQYLLEGELRRARGVSLSVPEPLSDPASDLRRLRPFLLS